MSDLSKCKITVIKRMVNEDLAKEYLQMDDPSEFGACSRLEDGQEFLLERPFEVPEGFCPWAWADIRHDILEVMTGGGRPWIKPPSTLIAGCTDWFRPVVFKIERVE
jgi:uncharacterized repeat protein (TIGR04076 family)